MDFNSLCECNSQTLNVMDILPILLDVEEERATSIEVREQ